MSHSYEVIVDDLVFDVCFTCTSDGHGDDAEIEEVILNGESVDTSSLYVKNTRKNVFVKSEFISLEEYLLDQALEQLYDDGGALYQDGIAVAEYRYDLAREEGRI